MEPLTLGAITVLMYFGNKLIDWGVEKAYDAAFEDIMERLARKSPNTLPILKAEVENLALPTDRKDIGVAVLVEEVKQAASRNPEFKAAVEELGHVASEAAKENSELEKAVRELTQALTQQPQNIIKIADKVDKIGVVNQNSTIQNQTFHQTF